jgi:hypothetical protein
MREDHRTMKKLMRQIESTTERAVKTREDLFARMTDELSAHEAMEEEIFYPALRDHKRAKEIVLEGYEEHHAVDVLVAELADVSYDDETWAAKFTVIRENIEHHIEEEEGEMFKRAQQVFDRAELTELGERMAERKKKAGARR